MAGRQPMSKLQLLIRIAAYSYLVILGGQLVFRQISEPDPSTVKRVLLIIAGAFFMVMAVMALMGTTRRWRIEHRARADEAEAVAEQPAASQEGTAIPEAAATPTVSPEPAPELLSEYELEQKLALIEQLAQEGKLEEVERLTAEVQRDFDAREASSEDLE